MNLSGPWNSGVAIVEAIFCFFAIMSSTRMLFACSSAISGGTFTALSYKSYCSKKRKWKMPEGKVWNLQNTQMASELPSGQKSVNYTAGVGPSVPALGRPSAVGRGLGRSC